MSPTQTLERLLKHHNLSEETLVELRKKRLWILLGLALVFFIPIAVLQDPPRGLTPVLGTLAALCAILAMFLSEAHETKYLEETEGRGERFIL